ncbi:MAG: polymer-forming cytoskeletal protein [Cyclobacteriaceae bacterium]|jgi:cytoskeletal protein CcmA (bactofilin family)
MFNTKEDKKKMSEESGGSSNIFGKGTVITGNIETYGNIRVEGKIIGDLKTKSKAVMGHSSNVEGNILAQNAEIAGQVMGTVEVSELLVLKPSAVINGDIITNKLIVESGATFNGGCKMGVKIKEIKIGEPEQQAPLLKAQS